MDLFMAGLGFGLIAASIMALAAVGFTLQLGVADIFNFSFGAVMTASALAGYEANAAGLNVWLCLPVGAAFGAALSVCLNRAILTPFMHRGAGLFGMVIVTLGLAIVIQNLILAIWGPVYFTYQVDNSSTVRWAGMILTTSQIALAACSAAIMVVLHLLLTKTKLGKAMRATAANADLARTSGIRTSRVNDTVWALSGALCGLGGVAFVINTVSFQAATGTDYLILVVAAAVLGGAGQPYGAMIGALIVGVASEVSATVISPDYKDVVALVILIGVLLVRPRGLMASVDLVQAGGEETIA